MSSRCSPRVVGAHERAHVKGLKAVLGSKAVRSPRFNFRGTTEAAGDFAATAQVLEDTGVAAYKGQAPRIQANAILEAALAIHTVEARHAALDPRHQRGAARRRPRSTSR